MLYKYSWWCEKCKIWISVKEVKNGKHQECNGKAVLKRNGYCFDESEQYP
jgi:hypothetical protein